MASARDLGDELKYDPERLPLPGVEKASDDALAVLDGIADGRPCVERTAAYARRDETARRPTTTDLLRTLYHADGELALVTWSTTGITAIGYRPDEQRFEVGGYSGLRELMGDEPEWHERCSKATAKDMLTDTRPDIVVRAEADLLDGGDAR